MSFSFLNWKVPLNGISDQTIIFKEHCCLHLQVLMPLHSTDPSGQRIHAIR